MPGISVVAPVRDDPAGAMALLDALAAQTRLPDEVIIVDDGSVDGTRAALDSRAELPFNYRIVETGGIGIAGARNRGISAASHEWIACTDAGCLPVPRWLEAIEEATPATDFVAGIVITDRANWVQRLIALSAFPRPDELDRPSWAVRMSHKLFGRGLSPERTGGGYMAFKRSVWENVGGFPIGLRASDDRAFSTAVSRAGFSMTRAPGAVIHWYPRTTLRGNLEMFFNYSRGDIRIPPRSRHLVRLLAYLVAGRMAVRRRPFACATLTLGVSGYFWLPLHRANEDDLPVSRRWQIPVVMVLKDLAQIAGATTGVVDAVRERTRR